MKTDDDTSDAGCLAPAMMKNAEGRPMNFGFGIDLEDIELARKLVEDLTGLPAEEEFHVDTGGIYYNFAAAQ